MCGGTSVAARTMYPVWGLSPRVRGNLSSLVSAVSSLRSIPACAGEPPALTWSDGRGRVYPRVCGGTMYQPGSTSSTSGLSPRVRGNLGPAGCGIAGGGSIPACAGEPPRTLRMDSARSVYPRVCGGTHDHTADERGLGGLSPRVRGNLRTRRRSCLSYGSIPACAGEPLASSRASPTRAVYPRVCGGTGANPMPKMNAAGLSPRVRGNPRRAAPGPLR